MKEKLIVGNNLKFGFHQIKSEWISPINLERLKQHRALCPNHVIQVVIAKKYLTAEAIKKAEADCKSLNVTCLDIDEDIPRLIRDQPPEKQKRDEMLLAAANEQLGLFFKKDPDHPCPGNLAAASDALRCISALIEGKVYSDFDTPIINEEPRMWNKDFLVHVSKNKGMLTVNNCIMAAAKDSPELVAIQEELIERKNNLINMSFSNLIDWVLKLYGPYALTDITRFFGSSDTDESFIKKFGISSLGSTIFRDPADISQLNFGQGDSSWHRSNPVHSNAVDYKELNVVTAPLMYFPDMSEAEAEKILIERFKNDGKKHYLDSGGRNRLKVDKLIAGLKEENYIPVINLNHLSLKPALPLVSREGIFAVSEEKKSEVHTPTVIEEDKAKFGK